MREGEGREGATRFSMLVTPILLLFEAESISPTPVTTTGGAGKPAVPELAGDESVGRYVRANKNKQVRSGLYVR